MQRHTPTKQNKTAGRTLATQLFAKVGRPVCAMDHIRHTPCGVNGVGSDGVAVVVVIDAREVAR